MIEDQALGINVDGGFAVRHTSEDEDGIGPQDSHDIEDDLGSSRRLEDEIDIADLLGKLIDRCCFIGDICASNCLYQLRLGIRHLGA